MNESAGPHAAGQGVHGEIAARGQPGDANEDDHAGNGGQEVAARPGQRGEDVIATEVFEITVVDRGGSGPSDEKLPVAGQKEHDQRNDDGSQNINVLGRVKRDAAKHAGCLVTEARGHPRVGGFMQTEGKEQNDKFEDLEDDLFVTHGFFVILSAGSGISYGKRRKGSGPDVVSGGEGAPASPSSLKSLNR